MNNYFTGDDIAISGSLLRNGQPLAEGLTGTLACAIIKTDRSGRAAGTSDVVGLVTNTAACTFTALWPSAQTGSIAPGKYLIEVQLVQGGQTRTFQPAAIQIDRGIVS